jgi:menaquinone-dependent protoporphyrinogen IX oxidase
MKQAIVFYSNTGNTRQVAKQFNGFDLLEVKAVSDDPNIQFPTLTSTPSLEGYNYVILATPVHGFQISKIMKAYLDQVPSFEGILIDLYITHLFPFAWMGGNVSLRQMKQIIEGKNGRVRWMTSVNWKSRKREKTILDMIAKYHA